MFNTSNQTVTSNGQIIFNNGSISDGIVHTNGTTTITINKKSTYEISYGLLSSSPNILALYEKNQQINNSVSYSAGGQLNSLRLICDLNNNSQITLQNISETPITLFTIPNQTIINVYLIIKEI